ncbi:MAG: glutathione peroxidase, partial [Planctomycetota bacterium]|nr:glutathione peroxidase [Planctomycetota bacterium]
MIGSLKFLALGLTFWGLGGANADQRAKADDSGKALGFKMKTLAGKEISLEKKYLGKVVLFVNVASQCGLTPQYSRLQALHTKYSGKGLA